MTVVTFSPEFEVLIPLEVREALAIQPGDKMELLLYKNRIELIPVHPLHKMRGFLRGIDTTTDRDPDRV